MRSGRTLPRGVVGGGLVGVVFLAWFVVVWQTGSPFADLVQWCLAVLCAVLAPGFVLVRVSRRAVAPLVEDLSWAAPAGCLVALAGWFLDRVLPLSAGAYGLGPLVVLLALAVPATRRRVLARPAPGWGVGPACVLAAVQLFALAWMVSTGLQAYAVDPGVHGTQYYPDVMYQLDLLGELRHALVPTYPPVAGTPLSYHWFLYAITAHLDTNSGVLPWDSTLRLGPATMVPAIIMLVAVAARRLARQVWAGPVAAVLFGALGISVASRWTAEDGSTGILPRVWRSSPPQTMGWVASIGLAGLLIGYLRKHEDDRAMPLALLLPFFVLTAGSKSSEIPVLLCGVALAGFVALLRREWPLLRRCVLALVAGGVIFEFASLTIYGGSSYGVRVLPFGHALVLAHNLFPGHATHTSPYYLVGVHYSVLALLAAAVLFLLPLLPRLLGLIFQVRYRVNDPGGWFTLGTAIAALLVPFVIFHPAGSQIYFLYSGYPVGVIGAASGLVLAFERVRPRLPSAAALRGYLGWLAGVTVAGAVAAGLVALNQPTRDPVARYLAAHPTASSVAAVSTRRLAVEWFTPTLELLGVLLVLGVLAAVAARRLWRQRDPQSARGPVAWLTALVLVLGTGWLAAALEFGGSRAAPDGAASTVHPPVASLAHASLLPTERDAFAAGAWVDAHAAEDDVVATNLYCRYSRYARLHRGDPCDARNFLASALTQRRSLVGGWAYADRIVAGAWTMRTAYRNAPFWNRSLLDEQYTAFAHPTAQVLADLYLHHHVRWMFLDVRDKPVDTAALDRLAIRRFSGPTTVVYELRRPNAA